jgi:hypothetical protein
MLLSQHPCCQGVRRVVWIAWNNALRNDGTCVIVMINKVNRGSRVPEQGPQAVSPSPDQDG